MHFILLQCRLISMHNFSLVVMAVQIQHKFTALLCLILWRDWRPCLFSVEIVNNQSKRFLLELETGKYWSCGDLCSLNTIVSIGSATTCISVHSRWETHFLLLCILEMCKGQLKARTDAFIIFQDFPRYFPFCTLKAFVFQARPQHKENAVFGLFLCEKQFRQQFRCCCFIWQFSSWKLIRNIVWNKVNRCSQ